MNVKELREGNLLNFHGSEKPITAKEIYKLSEGDCLDEKPIPITDEWMLKFGFVNRFDHWDNINMSGCFDTDFCICAYDREGYPVSISEPLKYVHQLQNA